MTQQPESFYDRASRVLHSLSSRMYYGDVTRDNYTAIIPGALAAEIRALAEEIPFSPPTNQGTTEQEMGALRNLVGSQPTVRWMTDDESPGQTEAQITQVVHDAPAAPAVAPDLITTPEIQARYQQIFDRTRHAEPPRDS